MAEQIKAWSSVIPLKLREGHRDFWKALMTNRRNACACCGYAYRDGLKAGDGLKAEFFFQRQSLMAEQTKASELYRNIFHRFEPCHCWKFIIYYNLENSLLVAYLQTNKWQEPAFQLLGIRLKCMWAWLFISLVEHSALTTDLVKRRYLVDL